MIGVQLVRLDALVILRASSLNVGKLYTEH